MHKSLPVPVVPTHFLCQLSSRTLQILSSGSVFNAGGPLTLPNFGLGSPPVRRLGRLPRLAGAGGHSGSLAGWKQPAIDAR
jgi:hypothetical protein